MVLLLIGARSRRKKSTQRIVAATFAAAFANQFLRATSPAAQPTAIRFRSWPAARRTCLARAACNSGSNAAAAGAAAHFVRITHPFHPYTGRALPCVGERFNRYGKRLLLQVDERTVCSVPPSWTDVVAPDPELVFGDGRALLRFRDLLELNRIVSRLAAKRPTRQVRGGKA